MYDRITMLYKKKGVSRTQFCADNNIASSSFSDWKSGRSTPKDSTLERIAAYLGVSLSYLKYGIDIEEKLSKGELIAKMVSDRDFIEHVIKLYKLPKEDQERAFHLINMLKNDNLRRQDKENK